MAAKNRYKRAIDCGDFEITPREFIASVSIVAIMILIGILISGKISESQIEANEVYNKALTIEDKDLFEYGMRTNIGNAFVYGKLKAVDTVTYPEIGGEYMYVKKVREEYTMHTKEVEHKNEDGTTYTTIEIYWTWDYDRSWDKKCEKISFCGVKFKSNKINLPNPSYIKTIYESSDVRYLYYGTSTKHTGTIFTELKDGTINNTSFYKDRNIEETIEHLKGNEVVAIVAFWIFWIFLTCCCVYAFYYAENNWLED